MPWCPKCRTEYREGFDTCSECKIELVSELEPESETVDIPDYDKEAHLLSVSNDTEAKIIEALLQAYGIPVLKKNRAAGGYLNIYMGATNFGIDLYVPSRLLEKAQEIIRAENELQGDDRVEIEEDVEDLEEKYQKKRRIRTWIIFLLFIPGLLWIGITVIWQVLQQILSIWRM